MEKEKNTAEKERNMAVWDNIRQRAYNGLCRNKCGETDPGSVSPFDIFFADSPLIIKVEDVISLSGFDSFWGFLKEKRKSQRFLGDEAFSGTQPDDDWYMGIRFCIRNDLSIVARDGSRVWALIYSKRNVPYARIVFRDSCTKAVCGFRTYYKEDCMTPVSVDMEAERFCEYIFSGRLTAWDGNTAEGTTVKPEEVFVSENSIGVSYMFTDTAGKCVSCITLTDATVSRYRKNRNKTAIYKTFYREGKGVRQIKLIEPLGTDEAFYARPGITIREQAALLKGLPAGSGLRKAFLEAFADSQRPDQEFEEACRKAEADIRKVCGLADTHAGEIFGAVREGFAEALLKGDTDRNELCRKTKETADTANKKEKYGLLFGFEEGEFTRKLRRAKKRGISGKYNGEHFQLTMPAPLVIREAAIFQAEKVKELAKKEGINITYKIIERK